MNLFLRRLLYLRPSLPLYLTTPFSSSIHRLLSTATAQAPPPNPHSAAVNYLIQSCGFSSDEALRASKKIDHLKSPDKPDSVLRFLRQIGIDESEIRTAVLREPSILLSSVDKNWRPDIEKLKEVGFPMEDISGILSRAEELGIGCSSGMFVYALIVVSNLSQDTIDARLNNLKYLGFSREEVTTMVRKLPLVLKSPEDIIGRKVKFLIKEVGCGKLHVVQYPSLLRLSLEKRLIPRSLVRKLLESKGFPVAKRNFNSFENENEKRFLEKFIHPYEYAIPGLRQAYTDACSGKTSAKE